MSRVRFRSVPSACAFQPPSLDNNHTSIHHATHARRLVQIVSTTESINNYDVLWWMVPTWASAFSSFRCICYVHGLHPRLISLSAESSLVGPSLLARTHILSIAQIAPYIIHITRFTPPHSLSPLRCITTILRIRAYNLLKYVVYKA